MSINKVKIWPENLRKKIRENCRTGTFRSSVRYPEPWAAAEQDTQKI